MHKHIKVKYTVFSTLYKIRKELKRLAKLPVMSLDFEVQSIYSLEERAEAKCLIKEKQDTMSPEDIRLSKLVANSSGLSHPAITKVTHVIFGISEDESVVFIVNGPKTQRYILDWIVQHQGKLLIHNSLFDLKIVYYHTGLYPKDPEDTQLLARTFLNHVEDWKAKSGLKHLMGSHYDPKWQLVDNYDIIDYHDESFLVYCSIDGAATVKLWNDLQEFIKGES